MQPFKFSTTNLVAAFKQNKYLLLLDQALLSIINFGSILLLAKTAPIKVFGSFVVLYSYHLFIFLVLTCFISTPVLVFLTKKWKHKEGEYFISALLMHAVFCFALVVLTYFFLNKQIEGVSFLYFFLLAYSITLFDLMKKFIFSSKNIPVKYALLSTLVLNVLFFYELLSTDIRDLDSILFIFWTSFFAANSILLFFILKKGVLQNVFFNFTKHLFSFFGEVSKTHYRYAKWILLGGIAFWAYSQGIYILAKVYGVSDFNIGKIRTIQSLLGVFNILGISIENYYTPLFSEKLKLSSSLRIKALTRSVFSENHKKVLLLFVLAIPIGLGFYHFMYFDKFGDGKTVFFIFLIVQFMIIGMKPFAVVLKSIEKTKSLFISHASAAIAMTVALSGLVYLNDYYALPLSVAIATVIYLVVLFVFFKGEAGKTS